MTDLDLYNEKILRLAESIPRVGRLAAPDVSATARSRLCGSRISIDLMFGDDVITDYAQDLRACVVGQAVASAVAEIVVGLTIDEVDEGARIMGAVLQDKTPPPPGIWGALETFLPVADFRSRHEAALLPFKALQRAFGEVGRGSTA